MRTHPTQVEDGDAVLVSRLEYEHLARFAAEARMPPLPQPDARGLYSGIETCRVLTARDFVARRLALGLTRGELAALAGIRPSTLERVETGARATAARTISKLERALESAARGRTSRKRT